MFKNFLRIQILLIRELFIKRPLLFICSGFIPGILTANFIPSKFFLYFFCLQVVCLIILFKNINNFKIFLTLLLVVSFLLGICVFLNSVTFPANHIKNLVPQKSIIVKIRGKIITTPKQKKHKHVFVLEAQELITKKTITPIVGKILVWDFKKDIKESYQRGQTLILKGSFYRPFPFRISKQLDYRTYLSRKNIYAMLNIGQQGEVVFLKTPELNFVLKSALQLKAKIQKIFENNLSFAAAGIMKAMVIGEREEVSDFFNSVLQKTGTVHILAVSGLHVGIITVIMILLIRLLMIPYRVQYLAVIFALIYYCFITDFRISVIRATIMAVLLLFGKVISRDYDALNALSLAFLIIAGRDPQEVFALGFQLSFVSVFFILLLFQDITDLFPNLMKENSFLNYLTTSLSVSLAAWFGTLGIIIYNFGIFSPVTIMSNIFSVSLLFLIIANGLVLIITGIVVPFFTGPVALTCEFLINLLYRSNALMLKIPGACFLGLDFNFSLILLYYSLLILLIFIFKNYKYKNFL
ncbi:MAG: ComEC/Rec2 family competence protein [Candidatus Omnitrophota bacterium]